MTIPTVFKLEHKKKDGTPFESINYYFWNNRKKINTGIKEKRNVFYRFIKRLSFEMTAFFVIQITLSGEI